MFHSRGSAFALRRAHGRAAASASAGVARYAVVIALLLFAGRVPAQVAETSTDVPGSLAADVSTLLAEHSALVVVSLLLVLAIALGIGFASVASLRLAASKARLASILEAADVGAWEWHIPSGRIRVDERWASMVGYREEEIERDIAVWTRLLHPDDVRRFDEAYRRHVDGHDERYQVEVRLRHRDGHWVWVHDVGQVVDWGPDGQPLLMRGTHSDISRDKERSEQIALVSRRDRVLLLLSTISEDRSEHAFAQAALQRLEELTDSDIAFLHFIHEDRQEIELFAWSPRTQQRGLHPVDSASRYPLSEAGLWAEGVRTRRPSIVNDCADIASCQARRSGHVDIKRLVAVPLVDYGAVVMLISVGNKQTDYADRDVETVQLFANEIWRLIQRGRYQASLKQASMVYDYAREGIIVTDARNRIVDVNPAFERISGYAREEVLGKDPSIFNSGRQTAMFYREMWQRINEDGVWEGEIWNRRRNGEVYPQHLNVSVTRDAAGNILNHIALFSDISLQKKQQDELERLVHYDPLTGLPNRVMFIERLQQSMAQVIRQHRRLAVAFMDLDGFKEVNDVHGHDAGDEVLIEIAARLKSALRIEDTIARLGGDEFVAILVDFDTLSVVQPLFDRLLAAASAPLTANGIAVQVSVSIGVSLYPRDDNSDLQPEQLVREADQAMYQAKNSGKNRLAFYGDPG